MSMFTQAEFLENFPAELVATNPNNLRHGQFLLTDGKVCRVEALQHLKTGKHGHAKTVITAREAFQAEEDAKAVICTVPSSNKSVYVVVVEKQEYIVTNLRQETGFVSVLDTSKGTLKTDLNLPLNRCGERDIVGQKCLDMFDAEKVIQVTVLKALGQERIVEAKELKEN